jgi:hypothetical protein
MVPSHYLGDSINSQNHEANPERRSGTGSDVGAASFLAAGSYLIFAYLISWTNPLEFDLGLRSYLT